jgi:hypothetical protein
VFACGAAQRVRLINPKVVNLNLGVSDASACVPIVRFVRVSGLIGRIWRGVCSHDVLTAHRASHKQGCLIAAGDSSRR